MLWRDDIEPGSECPVLLMIGFEDLFVTYRFAEQGVMPSGGGLDDQPAHKIEAISVIRGQVNQVAKEQAAKIREQNGH